MSSRRRLPALVAAGLRVAALLVAPPPAAADHHANLVVNGDYESGTDGWTANPTATAAGGVGCIDVPAGTGAYGAGFAQLVHLEPDTT
jgi:hypothetical protein